MALLIITKLLTFIYFSATEFVLFPDFLLFAEMFDEYY